LLSKAAKAAIRAALQETLDPSQGPNNGSSFSGSGYNPWTNPSNAQYSDQIYASNDLPPGGVSAYLSAQGFGFSIPAGATITGILLEIERRGSSDYSYIYDYHVYLLKAGSAAGSDKAKTSVEWPGAESYATYGSSSDLWGTSWSPSDINDSGFGAEIKASNHHGSTYCYAYVDHIRITVYYTIPTQAIIFGPVGI
jgi:hypothetical protein